MQLTRFHHSWCILRIPFLSFSGFHVEWVVVAAVVVSGYGEIVLENEGPVIDNLREYLQLTRTIYIRMYVACRDR